MTEMTFAKHRFGLSGIYKRIRRWLEKEACRQALQAQVRRERYELLNLDERELRDIGITREQALSEGTRKSDDLPLTRIANCSWFK